MCEFDLIDRLGRAWDDGFEAGFVTALDGPAEMDEARYLMACLYTEFIVDGVTQLNPIVHDIMCQVLDVLDRLV